MNKSRNVGSTPFFAYATLLRAGGPLSALLFGSWLVAACQGSGHAGGDPAPAKARAAPLSVTPEGSGRTLNERHLLLVLEHDSRGFRVRRSQRVATPLPAKRFVEARQWRAEVESSTGQLLFSAAIPPADELRGEFASADGGMRAVHFQRETFAFVLRVPVLEQGARIRLWNEDLELGIVAYPTELE